MVPRLLERKAGGEPGGPGSAGPEADLWVTFIVQGKCRTFPFVERRAFCSLGEDVCQVT